MDDAKAWKLIHNERAAMCDTLATLSHEQWKQQSLCGGWTVRETAAHIVLGAEQTTMHFLNRMAANGFRFNRMMDRDARRTAAQATRRAHLPSAGAGDDDQSPTGGARLDHAGRSRRAQR